MGSAMLVKWAGGGRSKKRSLRFWRFEKKSDWLHQRNIGYESAMNEAGSERVTGISYNRF